MAPPKSIKDAMEKQLKAELERRAAIRRAEGVQQSQILTADGDKKGTILRAEGDKQSAILRAEGQAQAISTVFKSIHDGNPDPKLLAYQYLQTLPQLAQGQGNTVWMIPSELTGALRMLTSAFSGSGTSEQAEAVPAVSLPDCVNGAVSTEPDGANPVGGPTPGGGEHCAGPSPLRSGCQEGGCPRAGRRGAGPGGGRRPPRARSACPSGRRLYRLPPRRRRRRTPRPRQAPGSRMAGCRRCRTRPRRLPPRRAAAATRRRPRRARGPPGRRPGSSPAPRWAPPGVAP